MDFNRGNDRYLLTSRHKCNYWVPFLKQNPKITIDWTFENPEKIKFQTISKLF